MILQALVALENAYKSVKKLFLLLKKARKIPVYYTTLGYL